MQRRTLYKPRYIPKVKKVEEGTHRRICTFLRRNFPGVYFHSDYAAGMWLTPNQAMIRKSLQSGRGWPDLFIAYPSRGYLGLFIEIKKEGTNVYVKKGSRKGLLSQNPQIIIENEVLQGLKKLGYYTDFGVGYDNTVKLINWYMCVPENESLF